MHTVAPKFVTEPTVALVASMQLNYPGIDAMIEWVRSRAPACVPDELNEMYNGTRPGGHIHGRVRTLFPHDLTRENGSQLTDNELLVELAGRKCYNSFGMKAGRKSNREYIAHTQAGDVPHASILYHAKMSFFIAGVSRRVSHELIRNYVGADRDEEGSPSQESTRYVEHPGFYVVHPRYLQAPESRVLFEESALINYQMYHDMVQCELEEHRKREGKLPTGMPYKRILEAASSMLEHSVETSFVWTTNPLALAKMFRERDHDAADLEFQRLAKKWKNLCIDVAPNLFPQPWMQPIPHGEGCQCAKCNL